ncbi:MAG: response regulator [Acidobacteriaceae bacterium]|nr:response regulator [Acidobacteriaceae bacterium]MBV8573169.1 response regulator [Acidobacteriaceae bacterium]
MRSVSHDRAPSKAVILLVDDNRDGVMARRAVLEELGYQVVSAGCGSDALELAEKEDFDLVITDYKMTPMDGLELIAHLRQRNFKRPIILLTGFADTLGLRPESTGADIVIQKSANEIASLVRQSKRLLAPPRKPAGSHTAVRGLARGQASGSDR